MYYTRSVSMLVPNLWEPEATDLDRIMCDQLPGIAGVGAATIAMQALGLSPSQAASLVNSQGGTSVGSAALANALTQGAANASNMVPTACNSSRLPITPTVNPALQFLAGDENRALLIIQNNEPAGGATLLVAFDPITLASPAYYMNFGPGGFGILLDYNCPSNPIYLGWSGSPSVGGMIMYGSKPLAKPSAQPGAVATRSVGPPPAFP
jgi:hypothetical protein